MRIGQLEIEQVRARRFEQAVDVEHVDAGLRLLQRQALFHQSRTQQIGEADAGRSRAEEQIRLVREAACP